MVDDVDELLTKLEAGQIDVGEACVLIRKEWSWMVTRNTDFNRYLEELMTKYRSVTNELSHMTEITERYEAIIDRLLDRD
ncbi:MAG: hypothetical protein PHT97_10965 [Methanoculleus sp.]|uniref:hypothetical protein n=1 Tax=Methanoculleus sp. TaxID=90427 RepID=UPI002618A2A0|nr:hypothetical protein [Methanoculleus sp.]MDD2255260.1 hypothetical protein [Methanoculleus sp.]MDD4471662.1 hypothetical protein [Methanoculleus sp.]